MDFQAIEIIQPAIDKVKALLLPIDIVKWMKLALIVLIAGASSGGGQYVGNMGNLGDWDEFEEDFPEEEIGASIGEWLTDEIILAIAVVVFLLFLFSLIWGYISSVFTFVFLEAAVTREVKIIEGVKRNVGRGLSLFLFRLGATVAFGILFILLIASFVFLVFKGGTFSLLTIAYLLFFMVAFIVLAIAASIIFSMAEDFAVPIMSMRGDGILSSMKRSLYLFKKEIWQFIIYYVMKMALGIAAGIISLILLIPLVLVAGAGIVILAVIGMVTGISLPGGMTLIVIVITLTLLGGILFMYLSALITLPIPVFFRYYSLLFLREMNKDLDFEAGLP